LEDRAFCPLRRTHVHNPRRVQEVNVTEVRAQVARSCPSGGVKEFGRRFPRRLASLEEGGYVRVEEDIA
jgi:hypothetical protein